MSDGISRIELKAAGAYSRYSDEQEGHGLLRTAPDLTDERQHEQQPPAAGGKRVYEDDGLLPVMIENGLEKMGLL
jgi:hypothetical protein